MDLVTIARILRPRGIKGEVAALPLSSNPDRTGRVFVNGEEYELENVWRHGANIVLKFKGIDSMSQAEALAGADVCIPLEERATLAEGEFYQTDLVGCSVFKKDGQLVGTVEDWREPGGPPLLVVNASGREVLIPFAKAICVEIDLPNRRIVIDPPEGLLEL